MIKYNNNIIEIVNELSKKSNKGEIASVNIYGYTLNFLPYTSTDVIRICIKSRLNDIKNRVKNIEIIRKYGNFREDELAYIATLPPDSIREIRMDIEHFDNKKHSTK